MITQPIYIISDLHLGDAHPDTLDAFERFIDIRARNAHALYILGDLFEAWVGDDDHSETARRVSERLKHLAEQGVPVYYMHGNRDFLIGETYLNQSAMQLLSDPSLVNFDGHPLLMTHGDLLCTQDTGYQRYRRFVHHPWVQKLFLALPRFIRDYLGDGLRATSQAKGAHKPMEIMDVNEETVSAWIKQYKTDMMVHGHTHRPFEHVKPGYTRFVLGAWDEGTPKILSYYRGKFTLMDI